jgi:hypothetical protein
MDDLQKEIAELKQFIAELKADREAAKAKEKSESWTRYVSLSVVIIAVIAAIAGQYSGKYGSEVLTNLNGATFNQTQASDQWAYYQAKSIKQKNYEIGCDQLAHMANPPVELIKKYEAEIAKYTKQQAEIQTKAQSFETDRDICRKSAVDSSMRGGKMGMAISFFSVSIATASICLVTRKKPLWYISLLLAGAAIYEMMLGWMS